MTGDLKLCYNTAISLLFFPPIKYSWIFQIWLRHSYVLLAAGISPILKISTYLSNLLQFLHLLSPLQRSTNNMRQAWFEGQTLLHRGKILKYLLFEAFSFIVCVQHIAQNRGGTSLGVKAEGTASSQRCQGLSMASQECSKWHQVDCVLRWHRHKRTYLLMEKSWHAELNRVLNTCWMDLRFYLKLLNC